MTRNGSAESIRELQSVEPIRQATGRPCGGGLRVVPRPPAYSLCVVSPYPGGLPDEYEGGQELMQFRGEAAAVTACERYARHPDLLPEFDVPGAEFLVVFDREGKEICRRPLLGLVAA